jgi:hypothetical protein
MEFCEHGNELSYCSTGLIFDECLYDYQLLKYDSALWYQSVNQSETWDYEVWKSPMVMRRRLLSIQGIFIFSPIERNKIFIMYHMISATCFGLFYRPSSGHNLHKHKYVYREILSANSQICVNHTFLIDFVRRLPTYYQILPCCLFTFLPF